MHNKASTSRKRKRAAFRELQLQSKLAQTRKRPVCFMPRTMIGTPLTKVTWLRAHRWQLRGAFSAWLIGHLQRKQKFPRENLSCFGKWRLSASPKKSLCLHWFASTSDPSLHSPSSFGECMLISNAGVMKYFSDVFNYVFINIGVVMIFFLFLFYLVVSCWAWKISKR